MLKPLEKVANATTTPALHSAYILFSKTSQNMGRLWPFYGTMRCRTLTTSVRRESRDQTTFRAMSAHWYIMSDLVAGQIRVNLIVKDVRNGGASSAIAKAVSVILDSMLTRQDTDE